MFYLLNRSQATSSTLTKKACTYETLKISVDVNASLETKETLGLSFILSGLQFVCLHFTLSVYLQLVGTVISPVKASDSKHKN